MLHERRPRDRRLSVRTAYLLIIFAVIAACVGVRQADPGFMARLRLLGFDLLQQALPRTPDASYPVRIVDIDEPSIKAFGNWPWRRDLLARLIDQLYATGVRVVVFDMVFPEPTGDALAQLPEAVAQFPGIQTTPEQISRGRIRRRYVCQGDCPPSDGARHYRNVAAL